MGVSGDDLLVRLRSIHKGFKTERQQIAANGQLARVRLAKERLETYERSLRGLLPRIHQRCMEDKQFAGEVAEIGGYLLAEEGDIGGELLVECFGEGGSSGPR